MAPKPAAFADNRCRLSPTDANDAEFPFSQVVEAVLLTAYNGSEDGWSQLVVLLLLKVFFVWMMLVFRVSYTAFRL